MTEMEDAGDGGGHAQAKQIFILATVVWWAVESRSARCAICGMRADEAPMGCLARVTVYVDPRKLGMTPLPDEALDDYTDRCWAALSERQAADDFSTGVSTENCVACALEFLAGVMPGTAPASLRAHPIMSMLLLPGAQTVVSMIANPGGKAEHTSMVTLERGPVDLKHVLRRLRAAVAAGDLAPDSPRGMYMLPDRMKLEP